MKRRSDPRPGQDRDGLSRVSSSVSKAVVVDGTLHLLEAGDPLRLKGPDRPAGYAAGFFGTAGRFVAVLTQASGRNWLWEEGGAKSPEFPPDAAGRWNFAPNGARIVVAGPGLYDSKESPTFERASRPARVTVGPVVSRDGARVASVERSDRTGRDVLYIDGKVVAEGAGFCQPAFSRDSSRYVAGYLSSAASDAGVLGAFAERPAGRVVVDGSIFKLDGVPVEVGFTACGRHHWCCLSDPDPRKSAGSRRMVINGVRGPEFAYVGAPCSNADGSLVAYVAQRADGRFVLVVNHEIVVDLRLSAWYDPTPKEVLGEQTVARSSPLVFTGPRSLRLHFIEHAELKRLDVTIEEPFAEVPSREPGEDETVASNDAEDRPRGRRTASEGDPDADPDDTAAADEEGGAAGVDRRMAEEIARRLREAMREGGGWPPGMPAPGTGDGDGSDLEEGSGEDDAGQATAPRRKSPRSDARRPGRPAKSSELKRFHGTWTASFGPAGSDEFDDVLIIRPDGTMQSDYAIDLGLEAATYEVREVDGTLTLFAVATDGATRVEWRLELKQATAVEGKPSASTLRLNLEQATPGSSRKMSGLARKGGG